MKHRGTLQTQLLSACMRSMPTTIRRVDYWWHTLYQKIGGGGYARDALVDSKWPDALQRPVRLRCGYLAELNLRDWLERRAYFSGHYYQLALELLIYRLLRPGDIWIDVGANIGLVSLCAVSRIGQHGRGFAFEPHPFAYQRLERHVSMNRIQCLRCANVALGSENKTALLTMRPHLGQSSLIGVHDQALETITVPVMRGDDVLSLPGGEVALLKVDVEGYELEVLRGLVGVLDRRNTGVIVEVIDSNLRVAGTSGMDLLQFLSDREFKPYEFKVRGTRFGKDLDVRPLTQLPTNYEGDVLFLKQDSEVRYRLEQAAEARYG